MNNTIPSDIDATLSLLGQGDYIADRSLATTLFLALKIEVTNELQNSEKSAHKQLLKERVESSFKRMVKLPESVDSENARSSYRKGVLEVILPKSQKSQVKVIPIT